MSDIQCIALEDRHESNLQDDPPVQLSRSERYLADFPIREDFLSHCLRPCKAPKNEDCCPICREDWNENPQNIAEILHCEHVFHRSCIVDWLQSPGVDTCPMCRTQLFKFVENHYYLNREEEIESIGRLERERGQNLLYDFNVLVEQSDASGGTFWMPAVQAGTPRVGLEFLNNNWKEGIRIRVQERTANDDELIASSCRYSRREIIRFSDGWCFSALYIIRYKSRDAPEDFFTSDLFDE
ncbi:hypothetical protein BDV96DRAFT_644544 [Lophiotrema nucula]|uniref:RING-type domain-containing protein n=1 Tax=Lophiotrema nucula TaxID=690887 RepID=A0A6A5ZC99_9PLEO|nr:hypothetical protein BDV96DRAFT_644544 [Lophiotrema nucula]